MLPYATVEEAEATLGRSLTAAETLWLNYSASKSDYFLYCHNIILLFLIFSLFPFYYIFLEFFFKKSVGPYKIQPKVKLSFADTIQCYKSVMRAFFLVVGPLQLVSYPSIKVQFLHPSSAPVHKKYLFFNYYFFELCLFYVGMKLIGVRTSLPLPSLREILLQLGVYFVIEDYTNYWIHRFLHCKWGYEKIHKVHHEYTAPIGFAAPYAHWAEILILGIPSFLGPAMAPGHIITFWLWIALRQIEAIETHISECYVFTFFSLFAFGISTDPLESEWIRGMRYDFPWTPTKYIPFYGGADYHDYHHYVGGQSQSNFASVFTYCDYIYGTDKGYRYQKKVLQQLKEGLKSSGDEKGDLHELSARDHKVD
ncbi:hypothetical protein BUALT_Bualt10G0032900 [Buddleja alternifolia]|uniref:Fatty acid hydroxylase domain-containing protein n=1 Tax=Buddleja alternifolia TaxID=168488 RepID=A0AAV6WWJ2_9LAMI|nr:hypothetical protein BUALT_Bualt10G0032900 [Buddleja alternifolia]